MWETPWKREQLTLGAARIISTMVHWLQGERLVKALACSVDVVENVPADGKGTWVAVVVAVLRSGRFDVIYPRGFEGPFRI